jgi:hypothetical protein
VTTFALLVTVGHADLERALSVGRRGDAERARFHAAYIVPVNDATVEQFEVLTEFRRAVIVVEDRAKLGDRMFGLQQLEAAMLPFHNQVTIRARLRFHPQNVLPAVPDYDLLVGSADDRPVPLADTTREPIFVPVGKDRTALMGATLAIVFDAGVLGQQQYSVAVALDGRTIASAMIDFARLD